MLLESIYKLEQVDIREHKTASGVDFYTINPKGNVPALILDDGTILNENGAVLQFIADLVCLFNSMNFLSNNLLTCYIFLESRKNRTSEWNC